MNGVKIAIAGRKCVLSCLIAAAVTVCGGGVPVFAEQPPEGAEKPVKELTPVDRLDQATAGMLEGMDENQILQFRAIEQSYRTIRAVEDVQYSVTRAVTACGKSNPEIKGDMYDRLRSWKETLRPTMKRAYDKLDKMVLLQSFTEPSSVRRYLKLFDAAVNFRNEGIKAVPVAEKEDCLKLKKSMDESEKSLGRLLTDTLGLDAPMKTSDL